MPRAPAEYRSHNVSTSILVGDSTNRRKRFGKQLPQPSLLVWLHPALPSHLFDEHA
jgi:hypothetical protein